MANTKAPSVYDLRCISDEGNASREHAAYTLASVPAADTVEFMTIPGGSKIFGAQQITGASLGGSTTVSLGWKYADGTAGGSATALIAATGTAAAAKTSGIFPPFIVEKDIIVYATVGGATASGQLDVVVEYNAIGVK